MRCVKAVEHARQPVRHREISSPLLHACRHCCLCTTEQHNTKQAATGDTMTHSDTQQDPGRGAEPTEIFTEACFVAFVLID